MTGVQTCALPICLEFFLFDIRTVLKPQILDNSRVATVSIGEKDISYFSTLDSKGLPINALIEILEATDKYEN